MLYEEAESAKSVRRRLALLNRMRPQNQKPCCNPFLLHWGQLAVAVNQSLLPVKVTDDNSDEEVDQEEICYDHENDEEK